MNISFDYQNTITKYPMIFSGLSKLAANNGHTVWVCSAHKLEINASNLGEYDIIFHKYFSIKEYHENLGTKIYERKGHWHIQDNIWDRTKGNWAEREKIDMHFDDSANLAPFFPKSCEFILVDNNFNKNFAIFVNKIGGIV